MRLRRTRPPFTPGGVAFLLEGANGLLRAGLRVDNLPAATERELRWLQSGEAVARAWRDHGPWLLEQAVALGITPGVGGKFFAESWALRVRR